MYQINVIPFGLCNVPSTFEQMMDTVLHSFHWRTCLCYLNNAVMYSWKFPEHLECLSAIFNCMAATGLRFNSKKCHFSINYIKVLGHVVSAHCIPLYPQKLRAVKGFQAPKYVRDFGAFAVW